MCFQLRKIDRQLGSSVSINFNAKFTTFNSNRTNTFSYPPNVKVEQTFLDHMLAIKQAMKEAWDDSVVIHYPKEHGAKSNMQVTIEPTLETPTKTISALTVLPSPVNASQTVSANNLCARNSCTFGKKIRKPIWVKCSHRNDQGQQCSYWVQARIYGGAMRG